MMPLWCRSHTFLLAACMLFPFFAHAEEGLPPPESHPLCRQEPAKKDIKRERVFQRWPDGSLKSKAVYFVDGSYVQIQFHQNGQQKLESHHKRILIDGNPRKRRHVKHGTEKRWHENGQLFVCAVYEESRKTGTWIYYREDGTPASSFRYEDDREVEHLTYSPVFGWQSFKK